MTNFDWTTFTKKIAIKANLTDIYNAWAKASEIEKWFLSEAAFIDTKANPIGKDKPFEKGFAYEWNWHLYDTTEKGEITDTNGKDYIQFTFAGPDGKTVGQGFQLPGSAKLQPHQLTLPRNFPDNLVEKYGADTVRAYLMFFARWEQGGPWNYDGIKGPQRLLQDVWNFGITHYQPTTLNESATKTLRRKTHQTIRKVTNDMESFAFNTAVAAVMELRNALQDAAKQRNVTTDAWNEAITNLLLVLAPIAPHITEELWERRGGKYPPARLAARGGRHASTTDPESKLARKSNGTAAKLSCAAYNLLPIARLAAA